MKTLPNNIALAALLTLPITYMTAKDEEQPVNQMHKVVFEVAVDGPENWEAALSKPRTTAISSMNTNRDSL